MKTQVVTHAKSAEKFSLRKVIVQSRTVTFMAHLFSTILDEPVSNLKALHLLHAHVAFGLILMLSSLSVFVAALLVAYFGLAVLQCSKLD